MNVIDSEDKLLTAAQLADYLQLPLPSVRRLTRQGSIPCFRAGRLLRYDLREVKQAFHANGRENDGS